jgi:tetratricopeptide (TPR) repeat protein
MLILADDPIGIHRRFRSGDPTIRLNFPHALADVLPCHFVSQQWLPVDTGRAMALYDAFISYSHAKDKPIAAALQSAIQKLGKPWYLRRALRLFRDDTSLSATPHLWPTIEQALGQSRFFLLLASPGAAASKWVNKEVAHWLGHNSIDTLLIGLTDGELAWDESTGDFALPESTPLPPALVKRFPSEPKWVDLRAYRAGDQRPASKRDAKFTELAADFAAAIRGMPKEDLLSQEVRQQRRALTLAWSAVGSLLVLAGLAGWQWNVAVVQRIEAQAQRDRAVEAERTATQQQQLAEQQRDRAEQTLSSSVRTANDLVFDLARRFKETTGVPVELRKDILDRAQKLQQQLVASNSLTPDLEYSQAIALGETVTALLSMGDITGAADAADRERVIMEGRLKTSPENPEYQRNLAVAYQRVGEVLEANGDLAVALDNFHKTLDITERLAVATPNDPDRQAEMAQSYNTIGDVLVRLGKFQEALDSYRKGLAINEAAAAAAPDDLNRKYGVGISHQRIGNALNDQGGDLAITLKEYELNRDIMERLTAKDHSNSRWQHNLATSYGNVGDILAAQGRPADAVVSFNKGLTVLEDLAASDPGNTAWQRALSVSHNKIGDALLTQDQLEDALASFRTSLAIIKRLAEADPANAGWRADLALTYQKVGDVLDNLDNLDDALEAYQRSFAIFEHLASANRDNLHAQTLLASAHERIGDIQMQRGDLAAASDNFEKFLDTVRRVAVTDPDNLDMQNRTAIAYSKFADVLIAQGREVEARDKFHNALAAFESLVTADSSNMGFQWGLLNVNWRLAVLGDDAAQRFAFIVATLQQLKGENRLSPNMGKMLAAAESQLEALKSR